MTTIYNIQKFDPSKMKTSHNKSGTATTSLIIGKRATGKTILVRDLLWHNRDIPLGIAISPDEPCTPGYGYNKMMPSMCIHNHYSDYFMDNVIKRQQILKNKKDADIKKWNKSDIDTRMFVVLDNCLYDCGQRHNKILSRFFTNSRQLNINTILTITYPTAIGPTLRANSNYVFLLRTSNIEERARLYKTYAGMFPSFEAFCQVMDQCTQDYSCLVIDNTVVSGNVSDQVFWYKADIHDDGFRMCAPEFWEMAEKIQTEGLNTISMNMLAVPPAVVAVEKHNYNKGRVISQAVKKIEKALASIKSVLGADV